MAFNQKTIYGLCNVLLRHANNVNLKSDKKKNFNCLVEHWARRMDLVFRDSEMSWKHLAKEPSSIVKNLDYIEKTYIDLQERLYKVDEAVGQQISKRMMKADFVFARKEIRETFETLKGPISDVKKLVSNGIPANLDIDALAAVQATIDVWIACKKKRVLPKDPAKNVKLKKFLEDSLKVFGVNKEPLKAYSDWYLFTQKELA